MTTTKTPTSATTSKLFTALVGVVALIVLIQGVFAGIFLRFDGKRDASGHWIDAHAWGAHVGTVLAVLLAVFAVVKMRDRMPLVIGSVVLAVAFLVESYLGGKIRDDGKDQLTAIHVPLAMVIMALTVWLSTAAVAMRKASAE